MEANVSDVLRRKGERVVTVTPQQTVAAVVQQLVENRIGAAPVIDKQDRLVGIVSERDIIRGISDHGSALLDLPVEQIMTHEVMTCSTEDRLVDLMQVMTLQRFRHLPIVMNGSLCGIVSIGDVVKQRLEEIQSEVEDLHRYIRSP
jgi:CBS domain-containing protein